MKVCVFGLWHLGCVTAACLSNSGLDVIGLDFDEQVVGGLNAGQAPIFEPGLNEMIQQGQTSGSLRFLTDAQQALREADVVWVTFDTPVDEEDQADVDYVGQQIKRIMGYVKPAVNFIISSQVPVGFTSSMEEAFSQVYPEKEAVFAYSPENLRLGKAIQVFHNPDRIVIGIRHQEDRSRLEPFFSQVCPRLEWMSTESAEMTKHAINAFLAVSVVFANELAVLCEQLGADAREVERGLKSEERIGPKAYVRPGAAFAGGTLARDIGILGDFCERFAQPGYLIKAVRESNQHHKSWAKRKVSECLGKLTGCKVGLLGLTYKPGTDTLRRSWAVELCRWLVDEGAAVTAFDPAVHELSEDLAKGVVLAENMEAVFQQADCVVVATECPEFRNLQSDVADTMKQKYILDAGGFLDKIFAGRNLDYRTVGRGLAQK